MAKYILKQEAIFALTNEAHIHSNPVKRAYTRSAAIIEQITAEEVQPVRHGRWVDDKTCSNCGFDILYNYGISGTGFCPNCGADMRGDPDV